MNRNTILHDLTLSLQEVSELEQRLRLRTNAALPSTDELQEMMRLIRGVVFPEFFHRQPLQDANRLYHTGVDIEKIYSILRRQIARGFVFCCDQTEESVQVEADETALLFMQQLPEIKRLLLTDVEAVALRDPAVDNFSEVVFSYPAIQVMLHHRVAHALYQLQVPIIPRIIAEQAHSLTGIDIHPAATIGESFSIDHGTGIVIGATAIIGKHVMLYQGVTLGAKNFQYDAEGHPIDEPRHPIIEDNVTIYSNASILGRIRIGHDSVIGGNVWLTKSVPPHSRILQAGVQTGVGFSDGEGI